MGEDLFHKIGKNRNWEFEVLYSEETYRKDGENFYCLIRKLMFGRYLMQLYPIGTIMVMDSKVIDEPSEKELTDLFQLGEEWINK
jgi:hypothetical protein